MGKASSFRWRWSTTCPSRSRRTTLRKFCDNNAQQEADFLFSSARWDKSRDVPDPSTVFNTSDVDDFNSNQKGAHKLGEFSVDLLLRLCVFVLIALTQLTRTQNTSINMHSRLPPSPPILPTPPNATHPRPWLALRPLHDRQRRDPPPLLRSRLPSPRLRRSEGLRPIRPRVGRRHGRVGRRQGAHEVLQAGVHDGGEGRSGGGCEVL